LKKVQQELERLGTGDIWRRRRITMHGEKLAKVV
jgi:hypothetical protein